MKLKQRPEDFVVRESFRFENDPKGDYFVYLMDKQKISTLQAIERIRERLTVRRQDISVCGLKDKQGRTEQLVAIHGRETGLQDPDLRLKPLGRSAAPLDATNIASNRFNVTVRDLSAEEAERASESTREVQRVGLINYFDSQRFGFLKHQGEIPGRLLVHGDIEGALKLYLATPSKLDRSEDARVKQFWSEHWHDWNAHCPYQAMQKYTPVLRQLREAPRDYAAALMRIDARTRLMMIYELQSLLWNESVKRYLHTKVPAGELIRIRYQAGGLEFPRVKVDLRPTFPLLAPDANLTDPDVRTAALSALARERLRPERLVVPGLPRLFFKAEERPLVIQPGSLAFSGPRSDEFNRGRLKVHLAFTLPPGAYATLVVRRILWFALEEQRPVEKKVATGARPAPPPPPDPRTTGYRARKQAIKTARATARASQPVSKKKPGAVRGRPGRNVKN